MRLIDADALIAETMKNRCADCDRRKGIKRGKITFVYDFGEAPCRACDAGDMIETLDEAPTVGGWISVKDRLPENDNDVLAFVRNGEETRIAACNYSKGVWYDCVMNCVVVIHNITHWMPLPEPPKEVTDGHNPA